MCRRESDVHQTMKRTWKNATNNESSKPSMPKTKKHKTSSDIISQPLPFVQESFIMNPSPAKADQTHQMQENHKVDDKEASESVPTLMDKEVTQILNTSDKENKCLVENENAISTGQVHIFINFHILPYMPQKQAPAGILKKLRTVYPSSKPSVDAMRRKYPILCSSGVAPKLVRNYFKYNG